MPMPQWLQQHLADRGLWDADGTTRAARGRRCRTCREYVLVGLDADRCALPVAVDLDPLSPAGEVAAVLAGRRTYALRYLGDHLELDIRGQYEMRGDATRATARHDVLAGHVCGCPSLGATPAFARSSRLAFLAVQPLTAEPPF